MMLATRGPVELATTGGCGAATTPVATGVGVGVVAATGALGTIIGVLAGLTATGATGEATGTVITGAALTDKANMTKRVAMNRKRMTMNDVALHMFVCVCIYQINSE